MGAVDDKSPITKIKIINKSIAMEMRASLIREWRIVCNDGSLTRGPRVEAVDTKIPQILK